MNSDTTEKRVMLIVEDILVNRSLLTKFFCDDFQIEQAENGRQALEKLRALPRVDIVLLDIIMPKLDGFGVLKEMKKDPALQDIPVVIATVNDDENSQIRAFEMGAEDIFSKPYNGKILRARVRNVMARVESIALKNKLEQQAERLRLAQFDPLTGLYTREAFYSAAEAMVREKKPGYYVLSSFDLNHFKVVNDQYGMRAGDALLKHMAEVFKCKFGEAGGICCRIYADRFAALYPTEFESTRTIAEMREEAVKMDGFLPSMSFNIGRCRIDDLSMSISAAYDRACIAQSRIKGRYDMSIADYSEDMREDLLQQQEIIGAMDDALRNGEFEMWLQPQYRHGTGALIGSEALVRWNRHGKKMIYPNQFIPLFEQNGFIFEVDKYVWEQACKSIRRRMDEGMQPLPISVNVSRYDLLCSEFYDTVTGLIEKYRLPVEQLRLEITESAFAGATDQLVKEIARLRDYGFVVEVDDFGSGYSSFNTLKDVPANVLKIDMRFLEGKDNLERGGNILEAIVRMAKWLGMSVIAEGVETREQADFLDSIGCGDVQGYLYARPMPAADFEALEKKSLTQHETSGLTTVETLDNNKFWDPASMDTLIFNNYIGGACIFEYKDGKAEMLRINKKFAQALGGADMPIHTALALRIQDFTDRENMERFMAQVRRAVETDEQAVSELRLTNLPGVNGEIYIRATLRVLARTGERCLLYAAIDNITAERIAEQRMIESAEQLRFLNETSRDLLTGADAEHKIRDMLYKVLRYFNGDIAYVYQFDYEKKHSYPVHVICASGEEWRLALQKGSPLEDLSEWIEAFEKGNYFCAQAKDNDANEKTIELMRQRSSDTVIAVPMRREGRLFGLMGVDNAKRNARNIEPLEALGDYMAVMLEQIKLDERRKELLDNLPCGAAIYETTGDQVRCLHINKKYCELVHRDEAHLQIGDVLGVIHPDDRQGVLHELKNALREGRNIQRNIRLLYGDAGYRVFNMVGNILRGSDQSALIYACFFPVSDEELNAQEIISVVMDSMMETSRDIIFIKDRNLRYITATQPFVDMVGLKSVSELVGKTDVEILGEVLARSYNEDDRRLMESGNSLIGIIERLPFVDGQLRYCSTSKFLMYDAAGEVVGLYGLSYELTPSPDGRISTQEGYLTANDILTGICRQYQAIYLLDTVSNGAIPIKRDPYARAELKGDVIPWRENVEAYIRERFADAYCESMLELLKPETIAIAFTQYSEQREIVAMDRDGKWQRLRVHPLQLRDGFTSSALFTATELELSQVAMTANDFIGVVNRKTGVFQTLFSKDLNKSIQDSYQNFDAAMSTFADLLQSQGRFPSKEDYETVKKSCMLENVLRQIEERGNYSVLVRYIDFEKERQRVFRIEFCFADSENDMVLVTRCDVTELISKEERQREMMAYALKLAEKANAAKSNFLSAMSHDIRTPMNAIIGMTDLALADESDTTQVGESLRIIKDSSGYLLTLINNILDMSRIENGKEVVAQEPFSQRALFERAVKRYEPLAQGRGIRFSAAIDVINDRCIGDVQRLERILDNLLSNALKFTPAGGEIGLTLAELPFEKPNIGKYACKIFDNGMGMDQETQVHIFEPFYRAGDSKIGLIEGTGLGLPIVKGILDLIGGTIRVESEVGKGSCFSISIPLRLAGDRIDTPAAGGNLKPMPYDLHQANILFCEDNEMNRMVTQHMLEKMNARVLAVGNGREGLEAFEEDGDAFDLILMDLQMPVMDGLEAAAAIRASAHPKGALIPIIALSAHAFIGDVQSSLAAGMNEHIAKPVEAEKLYETLKKYLPCAAN